MARNRPQALNFSATSPIMLCARKRTPESGENTVNLPSSEIALIFNN